MTRGVEVAIVSDMTTTEFAPVTLNGEPIRTPAVVAAESTTLIEVGGRLYVAEQVASEWCWCRRCAEYKQDFGGCIPAEAMWGLVEFMAGVS